MERLFRYFFENELITAVNFKDKKYGWNNFALKISTDKKTFCCVGKQTYYFTGYYNFYILDHHVVIVYLKVILGQVTLLYLIVGDMPI